MATETPFTTGLIAAEVQELRRNWGWFLALGIALIVLGAMAIGASFIATLATVTLFGTLLFIGGGVEIGSAFWARRWSGFFLHLLAGVLYAVLGLMMLTRPLLAAEVLTLLLASLFLVGGTFRVVIALTHRFHGWGWALASGVVTLLLGILVAAGWPENSLWVIGLFVGIELIFNGWSWVMLALSLRSLPREAA